MDEGRAMVAAANRAGVKLGVNSHYRWLNVFRGAWQLIRQGAIGAPYYISVNFPSGGVASLAMNQAAACPAGRWYFRIEGAKGVIEGYPIHTKRLTNLGRSYENYLNENFYR